MESLIRHYKGNEIKQLALEDVLDQIICADCLKVMRAMPSSSVHLAITSPPYNIGVNYDVHNDNLAYKEYLDWLNRVWEELIRILVNGGRFALNIAPTGIKDFRPVHIDLVNQLRRLGMIFRTEILWYKQSMTARRTAWGSWQSPSNPHIIPSWEYVYVFSKGSWKLEGDISKIDITGNEFKRFSDGFWHIPAESKRRGHPAPFPEELIYRLIKFYSYQGNVVLDMFGGTGTVAVVAHKLSRRFIHIDISEKYCKVAAKRLNALKLAEAQLRLLEKGIDYETERRDERDYTFS
jgi:site-specific DNA-methyltransferase (adenine-specific)